MSQNTPQELLQIITEFKHEDNMLKQVEKTRNPAENYIHEILNNIAAPIFLKDSQGNYLYSNKRYGEVINMLPADIIGKNDYDVVPPSVAALFRSQDQEVIRKNAPVEFEETVPLPDGTQTFITAKFPLYGKDGTIFAVGGYCTEITERKKAETAKVKLIKKLHAAEYQIKQEQEQYKDLVQSKLASLGQLAADVTHKANNPLGSIKSYISMIKGEMREYDSETIDTLAVIDEEINRIANTVKELLAFPKHEQKKDGFKVLKTLWLEDYEQIFDSMSAVSKRTIHYLERHYDTRMNIREIANHLRISYEHLSRVFVKNAESI